MIPPQRHPTVDWGSRADQLRNASPQKKRELALKWAEGSKTVWTIALIVGAVYLLGKKR